MSDHQKGYLLCATTDSEFYIPDALHVERDDELFKYPDDEAAAKAAEADGMKLIYGMSGVPDGVYVDTLENRATIQKNLLRYPEYRAVAGVVEEMPRPKKTHVKDDYGR